MLENIEHYLHTTDDDIVDPKTIMNVKEGTTILIQHISQNDDVLVQIDSDCDGYTSSALLINYLYSLFPGFVKNHIYYRIHSGKQHGIIPETVPDNIKLVIAPDSSSNDYEEHRILREKGIDVLVIDHHEADSISENAVIINNQLCDYPTKSLSGVGTECSEEYLVLLSVDFRQCYLGHRRKQSRISVGLERSCAKGQDGRCSVPQLRV